MIFAENRAHFSGIMRLRIGLSPDAGGSIRRPRIAPQSSGVDTRQPVLFDLWLFLARVAISEIRHVSMEGSERISES
jgi:hypothetical protein